MGVSAVPLLIAMSPAQALDRGDEASAWREYARSSVQHGLSSALGDSGRAQAGPASASFLEGAASRLQLSVQAGFASTPMMQRLPGSVAVLGTEPPLARFAVETSRFSTSTFSPQLLASIGNTTHLRFGLTIASQRFATPGFGEVRAFSHWLPQMGVRPTATGAVEQSYGQGVHLGFDSSLGDHFEVDFSLQSRVDMDAFKTYRGLFTEPGDFDVPARGGVSFGLRPTKALSLHFGAERVFYSDVAAFTTYALPTQLLALLGDGSAPTFAWRDLNVYSAKAELAGVGGGLWAAQVTTRQQPSPTSELFDLALRELYAGNHYSVSYQRTLGAASSFTVGASYAPAQYILGPNPFRNRYRDGSQVEVELNWSIAF